MRSLSRVFLVVAVAAAAFVAPAAVHGTTMVIHEDSAVGQYYNSCTNEMMLVDSKITTYYEIDPGPQDGQYRLHYLFSRHGTAVGLTSGALYTFNDVVRSGEIIWQGGDYTDSKSSTTNVIGRGSTPNITAHESWQFVVINGHFSGGPVGGTFTCR